MSRRAFTGLLGAAILVCAGWASTVAAAAQPSRTTARAHAAFSLQSCRWYGAVWACTNALSGAVTLTNDGPVVVGLQVLSGDATFDDTSQITAEELVVYRAVLAVVSQDPFSRVHVLLPRFSVTVDTYGRPYTVLLSSSPQEIATAYVAQEVATYAFGRAFPTYTLVSNLAQCASGIGELSGPSGEADGGIAGVISTEFPRLSPCVQAAWALREPASTSEAAEPESVPSLDDAPDAFQPLTLPKPTLDPVLADDSLASKVSDLTDGSELADLLGDAAEALHL